MFFEKAHEIIFTEVTGGSHIGNGDVFGIMEVDVFQGVFDFLRVFGLACRMLRAFDTIWQKQRNQCE